MTPILLALSLSALVLGIGAIILAARAVRRNIFARDAVQAATRNDPGTLLGVVSPPPGKDPNDA
jgi:hypothetical protein